MDNERYLYEIRPIKPIKDLIPGKLIKKPCSMQLTKDEVLHCMKYGSVWRRFTGKDPLKVTGNNLDFMHRSVYSDYIKPEDQKKAEEVIEQSVEEENIALEESPKESEEELQNSSNTTAEEELVESSEDITVDEVAVEDNSDNTEETIEETVESEVEEIADTIINEEVSEEQESDKKEEPVVGTTINNDKHSNSIKINTSNNYKNNKHKK